MKISELQALLAKVTNVVGDAEVILKAVESDAETVLKTVGIELGAGGDPTAAGVTISHGAPPPADPTPAVADTATTPVE